METDVARERAHFVAAYEHGRWSMAELCERFGISRPTGYKWLRRAQAGGSLEDVSRAPHHCAQATPADLEARIVAARRRYGWGATKLLTILQRQWPQYAWPARSTVNDLLHRHGLLEKRRRRGRWHHPGAPPLVTVRPNQVWPADFKGQFKTRDGRYCYPLTVTDHFSRRLLACAGLDGTTGADTRRVFRALFRAIGLPEAIRTDNGVPFAAAGRCGLTRLTVWWCQLGIVHQRIRPASPQENGSHERMHRDLKRETARPPAASRRAQQQRFNAFRQRYNAERPHEALDLACPDTRWTPSPRPYPERVLPPDYAGHLEVRRVSADGAVSLRSRVYFLSEVLAGQRVGLEEVDDGLWDIVYYSTWLGRLDERTGSFTGGRPAPTV
jgi:transposase InsO family protein